MTTESQLDYITAGPLLRACGISTSDVASNLQEWQELAEKLISQLSLDSRSLSDAERLRVYHYYLPVYYWCIRQLQLHKEACKESGTTNALVIGISAPQGCGKSTLVEQLEALLKANGHRAATVSIDDFYLTNADQRALAETYPDNTLLAYRGNAGTHDLALGRATLAALRGLQAAGDKVAVPRYDKSAFGGRGDRAAKETWPLVEGPLDIVLFEGWMSGFSAADADADVAGVDPNLVQVNSFLKSYRSQWDELVDSWLVIQIADPQWVYTWRLQAEERMKARGSAGMTAEQIADFVSRFMPAYKAYLPGFYSHGPTTAKAGKTLIIEVDQGRAPVATQPTPLAL